MILMMAITYCLANVIEKSRDWKLSVMKNDVTYMLKKNDEENTRVDLFQNR